MIRKKGFTLIELLAVVVLATISNYDTVNNHYIGSFFGGTAESIVKKGVYWNIAAIPENTLRKQGTQISDVAKMKEVSTFQEYDFTNIWQLDSNINDGFPSLR